MVVLERGFGGFEFFVETVVLCFEFLDCCS